MTAQIQHLLALLAIVLPQANAAIVDLVVIEGKHSACPDNYSKIKPTDGLNGDFNQGSRGAFIWLCVQHGSDAQGITDLIVIASDDEQDDCAGGSGTRIKQSQHSNGDFNHGAGGKFIYLCYEKQSGTQPLLDINLHKNDCRDGWSRIRTGGESNGDFNQGAGGEFIFMCAERQKSGCQATDVAGRWVQHGVIAAAVTETWKTGTTKTVAATKTEQWSESVTVKVSQGWNLFGSEGSIEIDGAFAHDTSESYKKDWSVTTEQDYQIEWGTENIGKLAWQFQFEPSDSCGNTVTTLVREFALTEGAWRPPCCVPGYSLDAPSYTTCHSADVMVKNGLTQGCKVASTTVVV